MVQTVKSHLFNTIQALQHQNIPLINEAVDLLIETREAGGTVYLFGNGGSHANASHMANDLFKAACIKAVCISEMMSTTLAYMNDVSPDAMFSSILREFARKNDVFFAFSCSGDSQNVVNALMLAPKGVKKILLTGCRSGMATKQADIVINTVSENIRIQESLHSAICHAIIEVLIDDGTKV